MMKASAFLVAATLALGAISSGCTSSLRYSVAGTSRAVGADAEIVANVHPDLSMTRFEIRIQHLPPPSRVADGMDSFVVWARRDNGQPFTRVGSLKYDPGTRYGEMREASVPDAGFQLIVTAEAGPFPPSPSNNVVIEQVVEK